MKERIFFCVYFSTQKFFSRRYLKIVTLTLFVGGMEGISKETRINQRTRMCMSDKFLLRHTRTHAYSRASCFYGDWS